MIERKFSQLTSKEKTKFYKDLKIASATDDPAAMNMWADDWKEKNYTLPFLLNKRNRFKQPKGEFFTFYDGNVFVACAGVYKSDFSDKVALAGTRTWIANDYRNQLVARNHILPAHKKWAIENDCSIVAICFNEYNKRLINAWKKRRLGEDRGQREPHHLFFNNLNTLDFSVEIQYTEQWIMYEQLDNNFDFDWSSIKFNK